MIKMANVNDLIFDPNTYLKKYNQTVLDKAMSCISSGIPCPPVDIDANMRIIGGHKQWIASVRARKKTVPVRVHNLIRSDTDALMFACKQLSDTLTSDERNTAIALTLNSIDDPAQQPIIKNTLSEILRVSLLDINKAKIEYNMDSNENENSAIVSLYLNSHTVAQISRKLSISKYFVIKTLTEEGLYTSQYKMPDLEQADIDDFIGNSLDDAISRKDDEMDMLLEMMEGTCASLTEEFNRYGMTLDNFKENVRSTRSQADKATNSLVTLLERLRSTIPVLKDPKMIDELLLELQPLVAVSKEFIKIVEQYKGDFGQPDTPLSLMKKHYLKLIEAAEN